MLRKLKVKVGKIARKIADRWNPQPDYYSPTLNINPLRLPSVSGQIERYMERMIVTASEDGWWVGKHLAQQLGEILLSDKIIKITKVGISKYRHAYTAEIQVLKPKETDEDFCNIRNSRMDH